jgi:hypothetical protein
MSEAQFYCVVGQNRLTKRRTDLTGPLWREDAIEEHAVLMRSMKKTHRYFHIAKYPYKRKN